MAEENSLKLTQSMKNKLFYTTFGILIGYTVAIMMVFLLSG